MRENRQSGSEGGGTETNRFSLPLSGALPTNRWAQGPVENPGIFRCVQRVCLALCLPWCPGKPGTGVLGLWRSR